jgi:hypothetical protein
MKERDQRNCQTRDFVRALEWRPRMVNGVWDGCRMTNRNGCTFSRPPDFLTATRQLFAQEYWGRLRAIFPQSLGYHTRPKHPDKSAKESRYYRDRIIRDQLLPFISPDAGAWDGKTRIDTEGNVSVMPRGIRMQMQLMVLEGYYGNVRWNHRAMRDFGAEG